MKYTYQVGTETYTVEIEQAPLQSAGSKTSYGYRAVLNGQAYPVQLVRAEGDGALFFMVGDRAQTAYYASEGARRWVSVDGRTFVLTPAIPGTRAGAAGDHGHAGEGTIRAPMPGHVRAVQAAEGEQVDKGQTILVLEAMKMEIRVTAPRSGTLARVSVQPGQAVEREEELAIIK